MRVITGTARGRRLQTLSGDDVRPTTDRIKEAVFSIIQFRVEGRYFLDLFAGCGQMGIEALSRGAAGAVFVDNSKNSVSVVKENLKAVGLEENAKIVNMDSINFLAMKSQEFDIAFLDPPYKSELLDRALPLTAEVLSKGGLIICESPLDKQLESQYGDFVLDREYRYGKIKISTFCHKDSVKSK